MLQTFCEVAPDYTALLRRLRDPAALRAAERIIQFPFAIPVADEKSAEEVARAQEKRREQGRKLQEIAAKARLDKARTYARRTGAIPTLTIRSCPLYTARYIVPYHGNS